LKNDGTVWAWGGNYYGQFGNGSTCGVMFCGISTPTQTPGLSGVIAVAGGYKHSVVLKNDGTVWVAGDTNGNSFKKVSGLANIVSIAAGLGTSMALKSDGAVWIFANSASPAASVISGLSNIQSIQMGDGGGNYAVTPDGTMYAWGDAYPGNGTSRSSAPVIVGVVTAQPPPVTGTPTAQVPALSEVGGMIMGALLLLISLVAQTKRRSGIL
jgi:alpha-tubulin suppressor-like RCC1 family protein